MTQACRNALGEISYDDAVHPGLLLARYLRVVAGDKGHPEARNKLLKAAREATGKVHPLYEQAFKRRCDVLAHAGELEYAVFKTVGRLIIGLGGESALETGITLHHTYGVPVIPGSALKGLAAHYCHQVWGKDETSEFKRKGKYHRALFGTNDDSGHIVFHDAWIMPVSLLKQALALDVMTPHHGGYYEGEVDKNGQPSAPTDFDDPKPISFLSVTASFHVALSCDVTGEDGKKWAALAMQLLTDALKYWGCGGKTSSGYGRLEIDVYILSLLSG